MEGNEIQWWNGYVQRVLEVRWKNLAKKSLVWLFLKFPYVFVLNSFLDCMEM